MAEAIRADSEDDLEALFRFRYRVYVEQMGYDLPHADRGRRLLKDPLDEVSTNLALVDGDEVVGSLRVTALDRVDDPGVIVRDYAMGAAVRAFGAAAIGLTSRCMIDPRFRLRRGMYAIIEAGYREAQDYGVRLSYADCDPAFLPFYEVFGYRNHARPFVDRHFGPTLPIVMLVGDHHQFERVRSPLARIARRYPVDAEARAWFEGAYPRSLAS